MEAQLVDSKKLELSLFLLRFSIFVVMLVWTLDKFFNPAHAAKVFAIFYKIPNLTNEVMIGIGIIELILIVGFLVGYKKKFTYGFVLFIHAVSTISSYKVYLAPLKMPNMLFWAAIPMLAACVGLFWLRDHDTMMTLK